MIYFITCRTVHMVKIGYASSAHHARNRLINIRTCCPLDVTMELLIEGTEEQEKAVHEQLNAIRVRGEWFWITETIERLIATPPLSVAEIPEIANQHDELERLEGDKWSSRHRSKRLFRRSITLKRNRLLRELAELEERA